MCISYNVPKIYDCNDCAWIQDKIYTIMYLYSKRNRVNMVKLRSTS